MAKAMRAMNRKDVDEEQDKKQGVKEGSAKDLRLDKKAGVKD